MFVYLNDIDSSQFTKTTLFNLVNTAEEVSPACQNLVFIIQRKDDKDSNYIKFSNLFSVIDAQQMAEPQLKYLVAPEKLEEVAENYGFFELAI